VSRGWTKLLKRADIVAKQEKFVLKEDFDYQTIFDNKNSVELEIGSGKGEFIVYQSLEHTKTNFLAIEVKEKRIISTLKKMSVDGFENLRILKWMVDEKIDDYLPHDFFSKIYINYPDPWPKKQHRQRRMISDNFVFSLVKTLKSKGVLQIMTDSISYANQIDSVLSSNTSLMEIGKREREKLLQNRKRTYFEILKENDGLSAKIFLYKKSR